MFFIGFFFADDFIKFVDVDYDGQITSADALAVLRASVGMDSDSGIGQPIAA